eukprot:scaffold5460_cov153-Skeletonema_dohrnii-CCMP3373.AAC.7
MEEEVEHHKEEEVERNQKRMGRRSHVLQSRRGSGEGTMVQLFTGRKRRDYEEVEVEEKEPIHSVLGRGGGRHEEEGEGTCSFGIVLCLLLIIIPS